MRSTVFLFMNVAQSRSKKNKHLHWHFLSKQKAQRVQKSKGLILGKHSLIYKAKESFGREKRKYGNLISCWTLMGILLILLLTGWAETLSHVHCFNPPLKVIMCLCFVTCLQRCTWHECLHFTLPNFNFTAKLIFFW